MTRFRDEHIGFGFGGARTARSRRAFGRYVLIGMMAVLFCLTLPGPTGLFGGDGLFLNSSFSVARAGALDFVSMVDASSDGDGGGVSGPVATANRPARLDSLSRASDARDAGASGSGGERASADAEDDPASKNRPRAAGLHEGGEALFPDPPVILAQATPAAPRGGSRAGDDFVASIDVQTQTARVIRVSRNSTAIINTTVPFDRAEVADPNIADIFVVAPTRVVVTGRSYGSTQMILWVGDKQQVFHVEVELNLIALNDAIRRIAPTARVDTRSINGVIVLSGIVPDADTAVRITELATLYQGGEVRNQLSVAGVQQTMLRVVVAEVNKEAVRQLGFNWAIGASDVSRDFFFANNVAQLNPTVFGSNGLANILAPNPAGQLTFNVAPTFNGPNTNVTFGFPRAEFQVFLNALRQDSLARILAEPNLVAISGQTATFLAGGEVPIPVTQGGAVAGSITIEFKEFGVRLAFTPTVLAGQIVRLHVMSEVSEAVPGMATAGGLPVFSFTTRRVESTIECGNGQTFALAGLLNEEVRAVSEKIPGLGDLPILGPLFSSVDYQLNNTELVILVTPQLVEPLDPQQVPPPPGALMSVPNDYELFVLGQLEGAPKSAPQSERVPREAAPVNTPPSVATSWPTSTRVTLGTETPSSSGSSSPTRVSSAALRGPWGLADFEGF